MLRAQWHHRQENALEWRIRRADLSERWSLETFPYSRQPGVKRKQIQGFAVAGRSTRKLVNHLARLDVLLIDEFGYLNLKPEQSNALFKLMEERYQRHSTIVTTNLDYGEWHNFPGNTQTVEALLSRLRHYCHTVRIDGPSLREPQS